MSNSARIQEAKELLDNLLNNELAEIIERVSASPESARSFFIKMPEAGDVDNTMEDIASKVARTANEYYNITRLASMARSELKRAELTYKRKYKVSSVGKSVAERDVNAVQSTVDEAYRLMVIEQIVELAEGAEAWARVASETARKLYNGAENMKTATIRETKGFYKESDFKDGF